MKVRSGFALAFVGLLVALYGLLGGPTANVALILVGAAVAALGAAVAIRFRS